MGDYLSDWHRRVAWWTRLGTVGFISLGLLVGTLLFLMRGQLIIALLAAGFLAIDVAVMVMGLRHGP